MDVRSNTWICTLLALGMVASTGCNRHKKHAQPSSSTGSGAIGVPGPGGINFDNTQILTGVAPATGSIYGGTEVMLSGNEFTAGAAVEFGGVAATVVSVLSANQIKCTTPAHPEGMVDVVVTLPDGRVGRINNGFFFDPNIVLARVADYGDPTPQEQELLELMQRARKDPVAEGNRLGLNFATYPARPPLSYNQFLAGAAIGHTMDMATRNFYGHLNPDGLGPLGRVMDSTYAIHTNFGTNRAANPTENIGRASGNRFLTPQDVHDTFLKDEGLAIPKHRHMILGYGEFNLMRETGIGYRTNLPTIDIYKQIVTEEFAYTQTNKPFIVGVVYSDTTPDGICRAGEGRANVQVTLSHASGFSITATTASAGGYAFEVFVPGTYTITVDGQSTQVQVMDNNLKADLRGSQLVVQQ